MWHVATSLLWRVTYYSRDYSILQYLPVPILTSATVHCPVSTPPAKAMLAVRAVRAARSLPCAVRAAAARLSTDANDRIISAFLSEEQLQVRTRGGPLWRSRGAEALRLGTGH